MLLLILLLLASNLFLWRRVNQLEASIGPGRMQAIPLVNTGVYPEATGFLIVSADGLSGAVVVDELPQLGEDKTYQLWLMRAGESASGATFSVDELGYGGARVRAPESLFNYSSAIITIEPVDGSPYPTSDRLLTAPLFNP
jgi:hypothetical protein